MIRAIFFDLDGTLLPMNQSKFEEVYFDSLCKYMVPHGYDAFEVKNAIFKGVGAMMFNDSGLTNEEMFWLTFNKAIGKDCRKDEPIFYEYYKTQFHKTFEACGFNPYAREIVEFCRENFEFVVLSTNPMFPPIATEIRMGFTGLKPSDFDLVTTYDNSTHCKPNPKYFIDLMKKFNLKPEEVVVVGNNTLEDCECALACGIRPILLKGDLILDPKATHEFVPVEMKDLISVLKSLI